VPMLSSFEGGVFSLKMNFLFPVSPVQIRLVSKNVSQVLGKTRKEVDGEAKGTSLKDQQK